MVVANGHPHPTNCERRIAAVVCQDLLLELASGILPSASVIGASQTATQVGKPSATSVAKPRSTRRGAMPELSLQGHRKRLLGVVLLETLDGGDVLDEGESGTGTVRASSMEEGEGRLAAVSERAWKLGVRPGQTLAEARVMVTQLEVIRLSRAQVEAALGRLAEALMAYGPTVSLEAPDTVWVDVSGVAHLVGGEENLAEELRGTVVSLGHRARVSIAVGPRIAQALARWHEGVPSIVVPKEQTEQQVATLPLSALPVEAELVLWLGRLGLLTVGELASLPPAATSARLGECAKAVFGFCRGEDSEPLKPHVPPRLLEEAQTWEEPVDGIEPLLFVLRGLASRISARLAGRGLAACECRLVLERDPALARFHSEPAKLVVPVELAVPLWREEELLRALRARLEQQHSVGALRGMRLEVSKSTEALGRQLDFSRVMGGLSGDHGAEEILPVLLTELAADVGAENVGVLRIFDAHRPELKSALAPLGPRELSSRSCGHHVRLRKIGPPLELRAPTRLLPKPVRIDVPLRAGSLVALGARPSRTTPRGSNPVGQALYSIENVEFERRLESVEWWSSRKICRDYVRLVLGSSEGRFEVLAYVDRETRRRFIYAVVD